MINKSIRVQATGSVANVSCGFDCLGFSIKGPSDIIWIEEKKTAGIEIIVTGKKCNDRTAILPESGDTYGGRM